MSSSDLRFVVNDLGFDHVNGSTDAEVAIGVEADFAIIDGSTVILREPRFEVLLLARELDRWLAARGRREFTADLGSVREDVGAVRIAQTTGGWVISSDVTGELGAVRDLQAVETAVREFVANVGRRVAAGGYDPRLSTSP